MKEYTHEAVELLKRLIATPSVSRDESAAADVMCQAMDRYGLKWQREGNNVWTIAPGYREDRPTLLLNAHIDTVKPVATWIRDPFTPTIEGERLYGLGANDCGGGLVALLQLFRVLTSVPSDHRLQTSDFRPQTLDDRPQTLDFRPQTSDFRPQTLDDRLQTSDFRPQTLDDRPQTLDFRPQTLDFRPQTLDFRPQTLDDRLQTLDGRLQAEGFNVIYLASAEEEVSGKDGIERVLPLLPPIDVAIVGEPTGMQPATAEKGLMVIDGYSHGVSGHAARDEGVNAIYEALDDLLWLRDYRFERVSPLLGPTKMQVTVVESGTQHNVVPDKLHFIIDVRTNEYYSNEEVFDFLQQHVKSELKARSFRLHSSSISDDHWLVRRCRQLGLLPFGSPTLSDQALMPFPSLKLGPGQSSRSHSADEYICVSEIEHAIATYCHLLGV